MTAGAPSTGCATSVQGQILLADRAYDSEARRESLAARAIPGQHQAYAWAHQRSRLQRLPLPLPQSRRTHLQQAQTLPRRRHPLRKIDTTHLVLIKPAAARIWMRPMKSGPRGCSYNTMALKPNADRHARPRCRTDKPMASAPTIEENRPRNHRKEPGGAARSYDEK